MNNSEYTKNQDKYKAIEKKNTSNSQRYQT